MTLKRGQELGRLPHVEYAAMASAVSALRSSLLPHTKLSELRKLDLEAARSALESTPYRDIARSAVRSAAELYAAVKRSVVGAETRVLYYAPKRAKAYLSSYLLHWNAEELKRELASKAASGDLSALRAYIESLSKPWSALESSLKAFEKSKDPVDLTLAVDLAYIDRLVASFNELADCERYELSGFAFPTLAWYAVKSRAIGEQYGKQVEIRIGSSKKLEENFLAAMEQKQYPISLVAGEEKYARMVLEWARNQAHRNQFGPAPAQAAFILKEAEAKEISEMFLEKLYGVSSKGSKEWQVGSFSRRLASFSCCL